MMRVADYVFQFLAQKGVRHVFLLPGGGCMHLVDALGLNEDLSYTACLHEQACAIAADAYAQYTNHLGVALVTTGPGGTNALTGVAGSWLDSIPVMIISGQVKRADRAVGKGVRQMGFQELDIVALAKPITKYAVTVEEPTEIRRILEKAYHEATTGRPGPVWVDIPLDVQSAHVEPEQLPGFSPPPPTVSDELSQKVKQILEVLKESKRPVLLAGNGIRLANALPLFHDLLQKLPVPVLLSWKAIDFLPEDHPLYYGRPGAVGQRGANFMLQNADFLLSLGARLDFGQIGYDHSTVAREAHKAIVDIDPHEIAKLGFTVDFPVAADAGEFLAEMLRQLSHQSIPGWEEWHRQGRRWLEKYPVIQPEYFQSTKYVDNYAFIQRLSHFMTAEDLFIPGSSGACSEISMQAFQVKQGQRIFNTEGLGPMGFGVPAALGGCIASGGRRTISVDGDGGFVMNIQELETIKRLNLPIKFFVLNNRGYGSIRHTQDRYFQGRHVASDAASGLTLPDFIAVGRAFGLETACIRHNGELDKVIPQVLNTPGPVLCEVLVNPAQKTQPKQASFQRKDGSFVSRPLEDLSPFLPREELQAQMLIPMVPEED